MVHITHGRQLGKTNKKEWRRDDKGEGKGMREKCICLPGKRESTKVCMEAVRVFNNIVGQCVSAARMSSTEKLKVRCR